MPKKWKIIARDPSGKETLLRFCDDLDEGRQLLADLQAEQDRMGLEGELALTAVFPEWLPDPQPEDYKHYVRSLIPDEEWMRVTNIDDLLAWYNLELGDMREYFLLAKVIPRTYTVIDFGCGKNAQSFLFMQHRHYYAVDMGKQMFRAPWTFYFQMTAGDFIRHEMPRLQPDMHRTFAICSNVTGKDHGNPGMLVRMNFLNMYTINNFKYFFDDENK